MLKVGNEAVLGEVDGRSLLDVIIREGARRMLVAALETEVAAYLEAGVLEGDLANVPGSIWALPFGQAIGRKPV